MAVGDGAHDAAYGEAVEVIVDEDQNAQHEGGQGGPHAGPDAALGPAAEGGGPAGGVDQGHDNAQQHQKQEDARVAGDGVHKALVDHGVQGGDGGEVALEQRAHQHADEQGGVGLLGDEGQDDGHHRRHQGHEGAVHVGEGRFALRGEGGGGQRQGRRQGQHRGEGPSGSWGVHVCSS